MIELHQVVRVVRDVPEQGVTKGMVGAVIVIFEGPIPAYEIEVVDDEGRTIVQAALAEEDLVVVAVEFKPGLQRTRALDVEATRRQAEQAGFATFVMPATGIVDKRSFFEAVQATFPLDPPLGPIPVWDALSDSLWEGLFTHVARRIVIVWPNARDLELSAPSELETALEVLAAIASTLAEPKFTCGTPKEIVVLVG